MFAITTLFAVLLAYPVISAERLLRRQNLSGIPACGQTCLFSAATNSKIIGSCTISDISCLCKNDQFQNSVQSCALSTCSTQDQIKMLTWATTTCPATASIAPASQAPAPTAPIPSYAAGLPSCGQNCLASAASNGGTMGSCSSTDLACLCKDEAYLGTVQTCVASQCSLDDKLTMLTWSSTTCSSGGATMGQTSSAAVPPATKEAPPATPSAPQPTETETSKPDSEKSVKTNSKHEHAGAAPSGMNQPPKTSQWNTSQDVPKGVTKNSTSANAAVMHDGINQINNSSPSSALQNASTSYVKTSLTSGPMQAASKNVNLNSTTQFTIPETNSSTALANTTSSLSTQASSPAPPQNTSSTPAEYAPDVPSASSGPLAGSTMWIFTAGAISTTLSWMN